MVSSCPFKSGLQLIDCLILSSIIANLFFSPLKVNLKIKSLKKRNKAKPISFQDFQLFSSFLHKGTSKLLYIQFVLSKTLQLNQLFVIHMNNTQITKNRIPPTPNLEEIKQKNKSKSKRKPNSIQPTNPPTPKIHKAHITLKATHDKHIESREQYISCQQHPERQATYVGSYPNKWRYCNTCYLLRNDDEQHEQLVVEEKKNELQSFKRKIMEFGLKLEEAGNYTQRQIGLKEQNFKRQINYISSSFAKIREDLDQKQRQLTTNLVAAQQLIMQSLISNENDIEEMKKALERYINEINNNYEDIVDSLPFEKFMEIIRQYHQKIKYFEEKVQGFIFETTLNAYIPKKQIEKIIDKANVQSYSQHTEQTYVQTRTLQRYPTQKHNLYVQTKSPNYHSHHQGPMVYNKISQHRQSRDRDIYLNNRILFNKQNLNYDNYM